ncbi:MAG: NUDIX domain-containing protein [bacterium]
MKFKYCPECGSLLSEKDITNEGLIPFCCDCNKVYFPFSYPCVICFVKYHEKYLLIKQNYISDNYVLVAGHIKQGSNAELTIREEIKEEVGLDVKSITYVNSYFHEKGNNIMFGYFVEAEGKIETNHEVDNYKLVTKEEALELLNKSYIAYKLVKEYFDKK